MNKLMKQIDKSLRIPLLLNLGLIAIQYLYLTIRYKNLNQKIPFWMTMPWGEQQLATRSHIILIPSLALLILVVGVIFIINARKKYQRYGDTTLMGIITLSNVLLGFSLLRIIRVASSIYKPLFDLRINQVFAPAFVAFTIVYIIAPRFIEKFKEIGVVTDPKKHSHPGMVLEKASARGGGLIFTLGVFVTSLFFVKLTPMMWGIFISTFLAALLGYLDDIQNTRPDNKLSWLEDPIKRMGLQLIVVLPLIISGVVVKTINNPFNGLVYLDSFKVGFGSISFAPVAVLLTIIWVVWIMNLLSWSNGVDGQYSGVIGIAGIMVAIMTLRLLHFDHTQKDMMELAAIVAGASLGLLPYSWHPSKIMWGFGAISAGVILAAISVVSQAKIATSIIVLTVPFLDGAITVTRRILSKKSPFKGDRGHLHHLLLKRGWTVKKVALFYWASTLVFGLAGVYAADKDPILTALTGIGFVAFAIISLNLTSKR